VLVISALIDAIWLNDVDTRKVAAEQPGMVYLGAGMRLSS
jgi:hypothetical protein